MGSPFINTSPPVSSVSPPTISSSVLLPQPLGPTIETNSLSATVRSTPASASTSSPWLPKKVLRTSLISTRTALTQLREVDALVFGEELLIQKPFPIHLVVRFQEIYSLHLLDHGVQA